MRTQQWPRAALFITFMRGFLGRILWLVHEYSRLQNTLEPFVPMVTETYRLYRTNALRNIQTFEKHLLRVQSRPLPRSGKSRKFMVNRELWSLFAQSYDAFRQGQFISFDLALAELFSGEFPEAWSLEDVYRLLQREREASAEVIAGQQQTIADMAQQHAAVVTLLLEQRAELLRELRATQAEVTQLTADQRAAAQTTAEVLEGLRILGPIFPQGDRAPA